MASALGEPAESGISFEHGVGPPCRAGGIAGTTTTGLAPKGLPCMGKGPAQ